MHIHRNHFHCCTTFLLQTKLQKTQMQFNKTYINNTLEAKLHIFWKLVCTNPGFFTKTLASILSSYTMTWSCVHVALYQQSANALTILCIGYSNQSGYYTCGIRRVLYPAVHKPCEQKNYHSPSLSFPKLVMRASLLLTVVEAITVLPPKFVSTR